MNFQNLAGTIRLHAEVVSAPSGHTYSYFAPWKIISTTSRWCGVNETCEASVLCVFVAPPASLSANPFAIRPCVSLPVSVSVCV